MPVPAVHMHSPVVPTLTDRIDQKVFDAIYSRALVYNTCWEDPAVDRLALNLGPSDTLLVITSAGCNVLDYALTGPCRIHAVDANPRQNALMELKIAGIRALDHKDFFSTFGHGYHPWFKDIYHDALRECLSPFARGFWDRRIDWFGNPGGSFYFHGLAGGVARLFRGYLRLRPRLARGIHDLFEARSLEDQRRIYDNLIQPAIWSRTVEWTLSRQLTMSMLGVPHPQRKEVIRQHHQGVAGFVRESVDYVFRQLPAWTNYFWMVYVHGRYTQDCCPEYLKPDNFRQLKDGLVDRIQVHTSTVTDFLRDTDEAMTRYVLLDHMDWMSSYYPEALAEEWRFILRRAAPGARVIFRSARKSPGYLSALELGDGQGCLHEHLDFQSGLATELQRADRVHTYAGFHVADLRAS
jgi:S-adenosylmethionine-diacylglycerol 3-amino-3-carboxypropyl transferase